MCLRVRAYTRRTKLKVGKCALQYIYQTTCLCAVVMMIRDAATAAVAVATSYIQFDSNTAMCNEFARALLSQIDIKLD